MSRFYSATVGLRREPSLFDGDDYLFVGFEPALGVAAEADASGSAGADDVSGFEGRDAGDVGDEFGDLEDEVGVLEFCRVSPPMVSVMSRVWGSGISSAVTMEGPRGGRWGSFCRGSTARWRAGCRGRRRRWDGVAEDVLLPVGGGDLVAGFADDEGEFGLVVGLGADWGG